MSNNVPNLDCLSDCELHAFAMRHAHGAYAEELGVTREVAEILADYAYAIATARRFRLQGMVQFAVTLEREMDKAFNLLPESVRW